MEEGMKQVLLNNCNTQQQASTWDEALVALKTYAHEKFKDQTAELNFTTNERRALAFTKLLSKHELNHMPKLTADNSEETNTAFIFYL
jgi:hypothetical protein